MTTFNWEIVGLERVTNIGNTTDVIITIHWRYIGINENNIVSDLYGTCSLTPPAEENFVPYEDVTKDIVEGWLTGVLDVTSMQSQIQSAIDQIVSPTIISGLPWVNN